MMRDRVWPVKQLRKPKSWPNSFETSENHLKPSKSQMMRKGNAKRLLNYWVAAGETGVCSLNSMFLKIWFQC